MFPIADELLELVNTKLSPYQEAFALSDLDIMSVNADGSVSSSTGHVEDTKAARPPAKLSSSPSTPTEAPAEETPPEESGPPAEQEPAGEAGAADPPEAAPEEGESSPETTPPAGGTAESSPPPSTGEMPDGGGTAAEAPDDGFIIMS